MNSRACARLFFFAAGRIDLQSELSARRIRYT